MDAVITFGFLAISFKHKTSGNAEKGRKLKEAGHVQNIVERTSEGVISSKVIRQTSINLPPYDVKITIDSRRNVLSAFCTCIAGVSGHCKHISATVISVNEEDSSTKTSGSCDWKKPAVGKAAKAKYSKGQKWEDIFGVKERSKVYTPFEVSKDLVTFQKPSILQFMLLNSKVSVTNEESPELGIRLLQNDENSATLSRPCNFNELICSLFIVSSFCFVFFLFCFRKLSNIQLPPPKPIYNSACDEIKKLFVDQGSSSILQDLYNEDVTFSSSCCVKTYNENIPCDALEVCLKTLADKNIWHRERKFRITASRAYPLYTYKGDQWLEKSRKYFHPKSFTNKFTQHGIAWEPVARKQYSTDTNCQVLETGLVVCQTDPWFAASPDGVVLGNKPPKLLEIKCPYIGKTVTAEQIEDHCNFLKREKGRLILKKKHIYYAQVQLNMAVLNLEDCDFVVFCSLDKTYKVISIPFDAVFAKELLFKLKEIYFTKMLHTLCNT